MSATRTAIVLALILAATQSPRADAQDATGWIGKRVVLQFNSVLRDGDQVVENQKLEASGRGSLRNAHRVYQVEHVNGPWIWLKAEGDSASGWILAAEVIPFDQAINYYTNQILANPASASAYISRGLIWSDKKEYNKEIADYAEAIRIDPKNASAYFNRGIAWSDKKDYDKAVADFAEAIRIDPKNASAYFNRGIAWLNKKEYDKAIADYAEAIRLDPKYASAYIGLAWIWATCPDARYRDGKRAVESATKACELGDWKLAGTLDTLAAAHAEVSDFARAVEWQTKAIALLADETQKADFRARLTLYEAKTPYRDVPANPTPTVVPGAKPF